MQQTAALSGDAKAAAEMGCNKQRLRREGASEKEEKLACGDQNSWARGGGVGVWIIYSQVGYVETH